MPKKNENSDRTTALLTTQSRSTNPTDEETYIYDGNERVPKDVVKVKVAEAVTRIGNGVFLNCQSLTHIVIPDSVITIGNGVFLNCQSLTSIVIPNSTTTIDNDVFHYCASLTSVVIPDSVTTIGNGVFAYCGSLTSIVIPDSITTIGNDVFAYCGSLTSIVILDSVTMIGNWVFQNCGSLTSIVIPDSVTRIGNGVFCNCESLISIVIPNSVTTIGDSVFDSCASLTSIVLPESITKIGNFVFQNCESLTSIVIPDSVTTIGNGVFYNCKSLTTIKLTPNMTSLDRYFFCGCSSLISVTLPSRITTLHASVFKDCSSLISVHLPTNLTAISLSTFKGCSGLIINAPSFPTTTFGVSPDELKHVLIKAGFSHIHLDTILYGGDYSSPSSRGGDSSMYYNMKVWGRGKDEDSGRLPLCTAAARCLMWLDMQQILSVNIPAIHEVDRMTGFPVFVLAAVGPTSDIESVFNLLREYPTAIIGLINNSHPNTPAGTTDRLLPKISYPANEDCSRMHHYSPRRISKAQTKPPKYREQAIVRTDTSMDKITDCLHHEGLAKKKRLDAMISENSKAASFRELSYSKNDSHYLKYREKTIRAETSMEKITHRLHHDGLTKKKRLDAMISENSKAASHREPSHSKYGFHYDDDSNWIGEKNTEIYSRLYNGSKSQRELGQKRREEIATAIKMRKTFKLPSSKRISVVNNADLYYRMMEQVRLSEEKKADLARERGVPFVSRYIKTRETSSISWSR